MISSHLEVLCKKDAPKSLVKVTGMHPQQSLYFLKIADCIASKFFKKDPGAVILLKTSQISPTHTDTHTKTQTHHTHTQRTSQDDCP